MITTMGAFLPLAGRAIMAPRQSLRAVLGLPLDRAAIFGFAALVIVLNLMLGLVADLILPAPQGDVEPIGLGVSVATHAVSVFGGSILLYRVGRMFGGTGDYDACFKTIVWFYFVMLVAQSGFVLLLAMAPTAAAPGLLLLMILSMVQLTAVTQEVHGFTNTIGVIFGIFGTAIAFGFVLMILLVLLGVDLPTEPPT